MKSGKISIFITLCALLALCGGLLGAIVLKDGLPPRAWLLALAAALLTAGGLLGVLLLLHIRSHPRRLQKKAAAMDALNEKYQQLAHHQRLEILGTLTSSIAHEFNNLLTPIMGYSLMALENLSEQDEELYDSILEIYNASRQAKTIISRLSDLSRKNPPTAFHPTSIDELVKKTLDVATPAKPEGVRLKLDLNCLDQRILANEIQLSQLLLNLILNSFQAMEPSGGELIISTSFDEKTVQLRVADTGPGIPQAIQDHIFEPFFTTKESGKGTGLGLAIAAQVVEDHHGSIRLSSEEGRGAVFTVTLPRTPS